ncbi:uncharacterized protein CXorf49 homolog [Tupaia chinensis]|uniref:uncharacterized protein CXorf49 homolog n=1 Tax=Tupaia chinensis TaxID=246437 RepID=UPI0003C8EEB5|nr:uncharacterized protein CXorf49 homolog [Tupaia chinensis]
MSSPDEHLTKRDAWGLHRFPTPESCPDVTTLWEDVEAGPSGGGARAQSCAEQRQAAALSPITGPEGGGDWRDLKTDPRSRSKVSVEDMQLSSESQAGQLSDSELSDESDIQVMRVSFFTKQRGQAWPSSSEEPEDTSHSKHNVEDNLSHEPGPVSTLAPQGFTSGKERQAIRELAMPSCKKTQNVGSGKGRSKSSHSGTAASGGLPRGPTRQKVAREKKTPGGASAVDSGRIFPSWGQRCSIPPMESPSLPAVTGVSLLGKSKKYPCLPSGPRHSKASSTGKKSLARRKRVSQPVKGEVNEPNRDAVPGVQKPRPTCRRMHHEQVTSGDPNARAPEFPENAQSLVLSQGVRRRSPVPSGNQEPSVSLPGPEMQQQPPEAPGCPGCVSLRKERDDLKEQLAVMQSLLDKFQAL